MTKSPAALAFIAGLVLSGLAGSAAAYDDGHGREWRQLTETEALSWQQVARVCALDGRSTCQGLIGDNEFSGWVWGTQQQVMDLFNRVLPDDSSLPGRGKLSVAQPFVGGKGQYTRVEQFLSAALKPTYLSPTNYGAATGVLGITSTLDRAGLVFMGSAGFWNTPVSIEGSFSVGSAVDADLPRQDTGVWLWRATGTPPIPEPATFLLWGAGLPALATLVARRRRVVCALQPRHSIGRPT